MKHDQTSPAGAAQAEPLTLTLRQPLVKKNSFIHAFAQTRAKEGGLGVFATGAIGRGEIVCIFVGDLLTFNELKKLPQELQYKTLQVSEGIYLAAPSPEEFGLDEADYFNHSCEPNLYLTGNNVLVAARDIKTGEELCYDYGTSDTAGNPDTEAGWTCRCGASNCRGVNGAGAYRELVPRYGLNYVAHYIAQIWRKEQR